VRPSSAKARPAPKSGCELDRAASRAWSRVANGFRRAIAIEIASRAWYTPDDFHHHLLYMQTFVADSRLRVVLWQIPLGNTLMRAESNTFDYYQAIGCNGWSARTVGLTGREITYAPTRR
jgi:hypothetical protein